MFRPIYRRLSVIIVGNFNGVEIYCVCFFFQPAVVAVIYANIRIVLTWVQAIKSFDK